MKFLTLAGCIASVLLAPAVASLGSDRKVPGESPLYFCDGGHDRDIFQISKIDILPNPPQAGRDMDITWTGTVGETITEGAYARVTVNLGLVNLITHTLDVCEQLGKYDIKCPITAGNVTWSRTAKLSPAIPRAKFTVTADVYTVDDESMTCLTGIADFTGALANEFDAEL